MAQVTIGLVATRPTRPVLRERYERRQQEVVDSAARVFAQDGYDQTSVPELADAIGLAAGSLYHYFGSKEQLLIAICDELMDPLLERARELVADDPPAEEQLRSLVYLWVAQVVERRDHMLVFEQERHVIDHGEQWQSVRTRRKEFERIVDRVLEAAQRSDLLILDDRRLALSALLGMVNHTAQWFKPRGRLTVREVADGYVDLLLRET